MLIKYQEIIRAIERLIKKNRRKRKYIELNEYERGYEYACNQIIVLTKHKQAGGENGRKYGKM
jgi:hypothetical protein